MADSDDSGSDLDSEEDQEDASSSVAQQGASGSVVEAGKLDAVSNHAPGEEILSSPSDGVRDLDSSGHVDVSDVPTTSVKPSSLSSVAATTEKSILLHILK